ncbi:MAG TPA: Clp protease N-terminal domain-containing protein [Acidobacteriaceae bacterium]|jgi:ATP-dependent Clp protease ATP-binding subunit ClpA|nr:Clp protease N-terminal domain-containing protein [Acidobacteriaceae bacterium]
MFERYNEKARRAIFFARYEASQFGTPEIESEHLLLGLLREGNTLSYLLGIQGKAEEIRARIEAAAPREEKISTKVDLPLTNEGKRILAYAAEEATRLGHKHIGIEHLILGVLREENCLAARILHDFGVQLKKARKAITEAPEAFSSASGPSNTTAQQVFASRVSARYKLVDAVSSETLLKQSAHTGIPCIGDLIVIRTAEDAAQSYRVQDVVWEFQQFQGATMSQEVRVLVAKVEPA